MRHASNVNRKHVADYDFMVYGLGLMQLKKVAIMKVTAIIKITIFWGVGLELLHLTLLFTGDDHMK